LNSQHTLPEKFIDHLPTTRTSNILKTAPHRLRDSRKQVSSIRTAWIRYHQDDRGNSSTTKSDQLIQKFSEEDLDIWILDTNNLFTEEIAHFDFVFLEYRRPNNCMRKTLLQLCKGLQEGQPPPFVILANEPFSERSIDFIEEGADAFFLTSVDNEVILARCRALLRRCYDVI